MRSVMSDLYPEPGGSVEEVPVSASLSSSSPRKTGNIRATSSTARATANPARAISNTARATTSSIDKPIIPTASLGAIIKNGVSAVASLFSGTKRLGDVHSSTSASTTGKLRETRSAQAKVTGSKKAIVRPTKSDSGKKSRKSLDGSAPMAKSTPDTLREKSSSAASVAQKKPSALAKLLDEKRTTINSNEPEQLAEQEQSKQTLKNIPQVRNEDIDSERRSDAGSYTDIRTVVNKTDTSAISDGTAFNDDELQSPSDVSNADSSLHSDSENSGTNDADYDLSPKVSKRVSFDHKAPLTLVFTPDESDFSRTSEDDAPHGDEQTATSSTSSKPSLADNEEFVEPMELSGQRAGTLDDQDRDNSVDSADPRGKTARFVQDLENASSQEKESTLADISEDEEHTALNKRGQSFPSTESKSKLGNDMDKFLHRLQAIAEGHNAHQEALAILDKTDGSTMETVSDTASEGDSAWSETDSHRSADTSEYMSEMDTASEFSNAETDVDSGMPNSPRYPMSPVGFENNDSLSQNNQEKLHPTQFPELEADQESQGHTHYNQNVVPPVENDEDNENVVHAPSTKENESLKEHQSLLGKHSTNPISADEKKLSLSPDNVAEKQNSDQSSGHTTTYLPVHELDSEDLDDTDQLYPLEHTSSTETVKDVNDDSNHVENPGPEAQTIKSETEPLNYNESTHHNSPPAMPISDPPPQDTSGSPGEPRILPQQLPLSGPPTFQVLSSHSADDLQTRRSSSVTDGSLLAVQAGSVHGRSPGQVGSLETVPKSPGETSEQTSTTSSESELHHEPVQSLASIADVLLHGASEEDVVPAVSSGVGTANSLAAISSQLLSDHSPGEPVGTLPSVFEHHDDDEDEHVIQTIEAEGHIDKNVEDANSALQLNETAGASDGSSKNISENDTYMGKSSIRTEHLAETVSQAKTNKPETKNNTETKKVLKPMDTSDPTVNSSLATKASSDFIGNDNLATNDHIQKTNEVSEEETNASKPAVEVNETMQRSSSHPMTATNKSGIITNPESGLIAINPINNVPVSQEAEGEESSDVSLTDKRAQERSVVYETGTVEFPDNPAAQLTESHADKVAITTEDVDDSNKQKTKRIGAVKTDNSVLSVATDTVIQANQTILETDKTSNQTAIENKEATSENKLTESEAEQVAPASKEITPDTKMSTSQANKVVILSSNSGLKANKTAVGIEAAVNMDDKIEIMQERRHDSDKNVIESGENADNFGTAVAEVDETFADTHKTNELEKHASKESAHITANEPELSDSSALSTMTKARGEEIMAGLQKPEEIEAEQMIAREEANMSQTFAERSTVDVNELKTIPSDSSVFSDIHSDISEYATNSEREFLEQYDDSQADEEQSLMNSDLGNVRTDDINRTIGSMDTEKRQSNSETIARLLSQTGKSSPRHLVWSLISMATGLAQRSSIGSNVVNSHVFDKEAKSSFETDRNLDTDRKHDYTQREAVESKKALEKSISDAVYDQVHQEAIKSDISMDNVKEIHGEKINAVIQAAQSQVLQAAQNLVNTVLKVSNTKPYNDEKHEPSKPEDEISEKAGSQFSHLNNEGDHLKQGNSKLNGVENFSTENATKEAQKKLITINSPSLQSFQTPNEYQVWSSTSIITKQDDVVKSNHGNLENSEISHSPNYPGEPEESYSVSDLSNDNLQERVAPSLAGIDVANIAVAITHSVLTEAAQIAEDEELSKRRSSVRRSIIHWKERQNTGSKKEEKNMEEHSESPQNENMNSEIAIDGDEPTSPPDADTGLQISSDDIQDVDIPVDTDQEPDAPTDDIQGGENSLGESEGVEASPEEVQDPEASSDVPDEPEVHEEMSESEAPQENTEALPENSQELNELDEENTNLEELPVKDEEDGTDEQADQEDSANVENTLSVIPDVVQEMNEDANAAIINNEEETDNIHATSDEAGDTDNNEEHTAMATDHEEEIDDLQAGPDDADATADNKELSEIVMSNEEGIDGLQAEPDDVNATADNEKLSTMVMDDEKGTDDLNVEPDDVITTSDNEELNATVMDNEEGIDDLNVEPDDANATADNEELNAMVMDDEEGTDEFKVEPDDAIATTDNEELNAMDNEEGTEDLKVEPDDANATADNEELNAMVMDNEEGADDLNVEPDDANATADNEELNAMVKDNEEGIDDLTVEPDDANATADNEELNAMVMDDEEGTDEFKVEPDDAIATTDNEELNAMDNEEGTEDLKVEPDDANATADNEELNAMVMDNEEGTDELEVEPDDENATADNEELNAMVMDNEEGTDELKVEPDDENATADNEELNAMVMDNEEGTDNLTVEPGDADTTADNEELPEDVSDSDLAQNLPDQHTTSDLQKTSQEGQVDLQPSETAPIDISEEAGQELKINEESSGEETITGESFAESGDSVDAMDEGLDTQDATRIRYEMGEIADQTQNVVSQDPITADMLNKDPEEGAVDVGTEVAGQESEMPAVDKMEQDVLASTQSMTDKPQSDQNIVDEPHAADGANPSDSIEGVTQSMTGLDTDFKASSMSQGEAEEPPEPVFNVGEITPTPITSDTSKRQSSLIKHGLIGPDLLAKKKSGGSRQSMKGFTDKLVDEKQDSIEMAKNQDEFPPFETNAVILNDDVDILDAHQNEEDSAEESEGTESSTGEETTESSSASKDTLKEDSDMETTEKDKTVFDWLRRVSTQMDEMGITDQLKQKYGDTPHVLVPHPHEDDVLIEENEPTSPGNKVVHSDTDMMYHEQSLSAEEVYRVRQSSTQTEVKDNDWTPSPPVEAEPPTKREDRPGAARPRRTPCGSCPCCLAMKSVVSGDRPSSTQTGDYEEPKTPPKPQAQYQRRPLFSNPTRSVGDLLDDTSSMTVSTDTGSTDDLYQQRMRNPKKWLKAATDEFMRRECIRQVVLKNDLVSDGRTRTKVTRISRHPSSLSDCMMSGRDGRAPPGESLQMEISRGETFLNGRAVNYQDVKIRTPRSCQVHQLPQQLRRRPSPAQNCRRSSVDAQVAGDPAKRFIDAYLNNSKADRSTRNIRDCIRETKSRKKITIKTDCRK